MHNTNCMRWLLVMLVLVCGNFGFALKWGKHSGFTRLVFELPKGVSYTTANTSRGLVLNIRYKLKSETVNINTAQIKSVSVVAQSGGSQVTVSTSSKSYKYWLMGSGAMRKLVVDVYGGTQVQTTTQTTATNTTKVNHSGITIVLDPGHGGIDSGAAKYVVEKEVALAVCLKIKAILEAKGVRVVMTRDSDRHLSADKRTDLSMRANMANGSRNAFVAVHLNSSVNPAQGIEVYHFGEKIDQALLSRVITENGGGELGQQLTKEAQSNANKLVGDLIAQTNLQFSGKLARVVHDRLINATGAVDRGVHSAPFYVIRKASIPAILIEIGFVNHPVEGPKLGTNAYQNTVANAIAGAILTFVGE